MNRKDYESYYKNLDLLKIVRVLENPSAYNKTAVEVAKEELKKRKITNDDYELIRLDLNRKTNESNNRSRKARVIKTKVKHEVNSKIDDTLEAINPLTTNSSNTSIKLLSIYFVITGIITLINHYGLLVYINQEEDLSFTITEYFTVGKSILAIICAYLIWKIRKLGWYMSITLSTIGILTNIYWLLTFEYLQSLMPFFLSILLHGSIIYYLIIERQRELFSIEIESVYKFIMVLIGLIALSNFMYILI